MNIIVSGFHLSQKIVIEMLKPFQIDYCNFINLKGVLSDLPNVRKYDCPNYEKVLWAQYEVDWNEILPLDEELITQMRDCEAIVYRMMDTLESIYFLAYYERKLFYYRHLRYWNHILETKKIDAFIACEIPHDMYDYVIYSLCKIKNIPTLIMNYSSVEGCSFLIEDLELSAIQLGRKYQELVQAGLDPETVTLSPKFQRAYDYQVRAESDPVPYGIKILQAVEAGVLPRSIFSSTSEDLQEIKQSSNISSFVNLDVTGKHLDSRARPTELSSVNSAPVSGLAAKSWVARLKRLYHSWQSLYHALRFGNAGQDVHRQQRQQKQAETEARRAAESYAQQLNDMYEQHTVVPDLAQKYIYVPLQYQPECTSSPMAGAYVDQILIVQLLAAVVPDDVYLYVKEHPYQKQIGRSLFFYQDLIAVQKVRLIPKDYNSFRLLENCLAVATSTGTPGWEALFREKPVLMFGHFFYQYALGVFPIRTQEDGRQAMRQILEEGVKPSLARMKLFLKAMELVGISGTVDSLFHEPAGLNTEESNHNIATAFIERLKQIESRALLKSS